MNNEVIVPFFAVLDNLPMKVLKLSYQTDVVEIDMRGKRINVPSLTTVIAECKCMIDSSNHTVTTYGEFRDLISIETVTELYPEYLI